MRIGVADVSARKQAHAARIVSGHAGSIIVAGIASAELLKRSRQRR